MGEAEGETRSGSAPDARIAKQLVSSFALPVSIM
jgi:hypothetical protein